ncbi:GNAT family N-acetyltransferase [Niveibacterium sp. 24ML]|uniref:GNAT family N-acetyltransferase n=1 Tax=Niveibacterium sp. 24ML TaxID=2985512 RepID=UPI00226D9B57|nr:GNAT family N-acetyltransferase [Niveibacterium sp. 24ML]MCX9155437.1 GNAT family N-acetyltransferase [Niveibacterium sp. 24ML]
MQTRPIAPADIPLLAPIFVDVFNAAPWHDGWTLEVAIERLDVLAANPNFRGFAIWEESTPLGFVMGARERWSDGWFFFLREMCVARSRQGEGIGRRLMEATCDELREEGISSINLQTGAAAPAHQFYAKLGFSEMPLITMGRLLNP